MTAAYEEHDNSNEQQRGAEVVEFSKAQLPQHTADLHRKFDKNRTTNDLVEELFLMLYDKEEFRRLIDGVANYDSVEGSTHADDLEAAGMVRDAAPQGSPLKSKNKETLRHSLGVVLRRYGISRKQRKNKLSDEPQS